MRILFTERVERDAFRILGAIAFMAIGILSYAYFQHSKQLSQIVKQNCEMNRELISKTVLRNVGANYAQYKASPEQVLIRYEQQLMQISLYRDNPYLVDRVIANTRETLRDADPERCKEVSLKP